MIEIALWNASSLPNPGDHLIDFVMKQELSRRLTDVQITTYSPWCSSRPLSISRDGRWDSWGGEPHAIVVGGGALITGPPFYSPAEQFFLFGPYPERFKSQAPAHMFGICVDNQDCFPRGETAGFLECALSRFDSIVTRNQHSNDALAVYAGTVPISTAPDVTWSLIPPHKGRPIPARPKIACLIGNPGFHKDTLRLMSESFKHHSSTARPELLKRTPAAVDFAPDLQQDETAVSMCHQLARLARHPSYELHIVSVNNMYGDAQLAEYLLRSVPGVGFHQLDCTIGSHDIEFFKQFDIVLSTRFHNCIMALLAGCRVIGLDLSFPSVWGHTKLSALLRDCQLNASYVSREEIPNVGSVLEAVGIVLDNRASSAAQENYDQSQRSFDFLASELMFGTRQWISRG